MSGDRHPDVDDIIGCKMTSCHMKPSGKHHGISKTKLRAIVHERKKECVGKYNTIFQSSERDFGMNSYGASATILQLERRHCTIGMHWDEN